jgi:arylsulfatase
MAAVLAVGALLGYLAAAGNLNPLSRASATPPAQAGGVKSAEPSGGAKPACCSEVNRGQLVALADPKFAGHAQEGGKKPNVLFIMGDDIGWFQIGAYHRGMMSGKTPNLDKLAREGVLFTDYYAEASCTAGRANFITGEIPLRTGLTTVGQAGADVGIPDQACTIATALKAQGYTTGQFGKNHLGDLNKYLPTVHGFDEFFGYLYHLDALSDPYWYSFPVDEAYYNKYGPRSLVHCWAQDTDDATEMPRWGKVGKQRIVDEGPLPPFADMSNVANMHDIPFLKAKYNMTTFDEDLVKTSCELWTRPRRMASRSSSGTTRRACTSGRSCPRSTRRCKTAALITGLKRAAWRSSMTVSAHF